MNFKISGIISLVLTLFVFIPFLASAQPGGGLPDDPGTPIDGGASLLVGAAAVYGIRKLKSRRAKQNTGTDK